MNFQAFQMEQTTLTLTQLHLGAELMWEPKVGTAEHDRCVDAYIPGAITLQSKRATIACDFFNTVEATTMPYPFTRTYHVSIPVQNSPASFVSCDSFSSVASSPAAPPKPTGTKRAHDGASTSGKRLPGFSIMTRDGVDITENQSRGPKTKEQREHAAKMRKLGACPSCKRRKQKCEPSHHRTSGPSVAATPVSSSMSAHSSMPSLTVPSPSIGSRASISPQSSLESAFTPPSSMEMPTGASKQLQPWEEGLLPIEFLVDDFMLRDSEYDSFAFGHDMFSQTASAGNWDFASPPMGQDFDLFSYDNTLDFDASLYVNTPPSLLQSSSLSPSPLQQPPHALSQSLKQSVDSQSPFAYYVNGQHLGNVDGTTGEYDIAVGFGDTGGRDTLAPDRQKPAREPQEGAKTLGLGLQSSALAKNQRSIPQIGVVSPHSMGLSGQSIATSPESSFLSSLQSTPQHSPMAEATSSYGHADFSDLSQRSVTGSPLTLHEQHRNATGLLTPPGSLRSSLSETLEDSFGSPIGRSQHVSSQPLETKGQTTSLGSRQPSVPPTSSVSSFLDSFEDFSMSSTAKAVQQSSLRRAQQTSSPAQGSADCGLCSTATPDTGSSMVARATTTHNQSGSSHILEAEAFIIRTAVRTTDDTTLNTLPLRTEHTAAKTHSLATSTFYASDTQGVTTTAQKLASTNGLVVCRDTKKDTSAMQISSMVSMLQKTISTLFQHLTLGLRLGQSQARRKEKIMGRRQEKDLKVMMGGLRLC